VPVAPTPVPSPAPRPRGLSLRGLPLLVPLDLVIGSLAILFFLGSALAGGGDVSASLAGALLIMLVMFVVGAAVEVIIEAWRDVHGLGTLVGFITNGPEALCLVVGLLAGDLIFAASTPLGSNFLNPLMLLGAGVATGCTAAVFGQHRTTTLITLVVTALLAGVFFLIEPRFYLAWFGVTLAASLALFWRRQADAGEESSAGSLFRRWHALPAGILLVAAGYALDPVVSYTAAASRAPKGLIGFVVLAALTSWPEFRSCLTLCRRGRTTSAVLNITVSNLTNLWLALVGVAVHMLVF